MSLRVGHGPFDGPCARVLHVYGRMLQRVGVCYDRS